MVHNPSNQYLRRKNINNVQLIHSSITETWAFLIYNFSSIYNEIRKYRRGAIKLRLRQGWTVKSPTWEKFHGGMKSCKNEAISQHSDLGQYYSICNADKCQNVGWKLQLCNFSSSGHLHSDAEIFSMKIGIKRGKLLPMNTKRYSDRF